MRERTARVWAEEVEPPSTLRFTWLISGDDEPEDHTDVVAAALRDTAGVVEVSRDAEGLLVVIDPEQVTRYRLAATIRRALGVGAPKLDDPAPSVARVWAEDLAEDRMRITWARTDDGERGDEPEARRRVAAWLAAMAGVRSTQPDDEGVLVRYHPDQLDRAAVGNAVRNALADDVPLRQRADDLLRRAPTYGKLAQRLAMDERVSPLPEAAKQALASRGRGGVVGASARTTAMRFIPGATMISRIQTLLPVLQELSTWSRDADPEIVEEHLASVGLTREVLKQDTVTAHEIRFYARDFASEATSELADRAAQGARRALATGKHVIAAVRESAAEARALDEPAAADAVHQDREGDTPDEDSAAGDVRS